METDRTDGVLTPLEFIREQTGRACDASDAIEELGLDSLELLELQLECEKRFGKRISDEQQAMLLTVGDLADAFETIH